MQTNEPSKPAEAQSFLTDELDAARFRWLVDQHTSIESTGDENEYANCHIEYFCADIEDDRAQSVRKMIDREMNKVPNAK